MEQITRSEVNSKLILLLEQAEIAATAEGANSKDKTLYYKILCDLGALDNIIAEEHEEIFDISKSNVSKLKLPNIKDKKAIGE